jgi:hypothetical protein
MRPAFVVLLLCLGLVLAAGCLAPGGAGPTPTPNATYTPAQLKYLLLANYGESRFFFCDPDYYPVAHGDEQERAIRTFPTIENDSATFTAIVARAGLKPPYSNESILTIYREYKKLKAISLEPAGTGAYSFSLRLRTTTKGVEVAGTIRSDGTILGERFEAAFLTCPVCLSGETLIDTPSGPVPVKDIREGMLIWTVGRDGAMEPAAVLRAEKTRVPDGHRLVRLQLSDGRDLLASPGHPLLDGRALGALGVGDVVDGVAVTGVTTVASSGGFTYDILPAGATGGYWANGIPLKSTLFSDPGTTRDNPFPGHRGKPG